MIDLHEPHFGVSLTKKFDLSEPVKGFEKRNWGCDEILWVAEDTFEVEYDGKPVKLRTVIVDSDFVALTGETTDEGHTNVVGIYFLPDIDTMPESIRDDYHDGCGLGPDETLDYYDLFLYGAFVKADEESCMADESENLVKFASGLKDMVESLAGFTLDKAWNRAGNTGWDQVAKWV